MTTITGVVEQVGKKERNTRYGSKTAFSLKVDGQWYNCGFTNPRVTDGTEVSFSYAEGAYGKDIDMASLAHESKAAVPARPSTAPAPRTTAGVSGGYGGKGVFPIPALDGQRAIVRQNSLTNAVNLLKDIHDFDSDGKAIDEVVISLARKFEAYSCGDLDALQAAEISKAKRAKAGPDDEAA